MRKQTVAAIIILISFCGVVFISRTKPKVQTEYIKMTTAPDLNLNRRVDIIMDLLLQDRYDEAVAEIENIYSIDLSDTKTINPLRLGNYHWACEYAKGMKAYANGRCLDAYSHIEHLNRDLMPKVLLEHFDEHFQEVYDVAKDAYDQEVIRKSVETEKKNKEYLEYVNSKSKEITEYLENKNYRSASYYAEELCNSKDFSWDKLDKKTHDTLFSLLKYAKAMECCNEDFVFLSDIYIDEVVRSDLPESLRKQYDENCKKTKALYQAQIDAYMNENNVSHGFSSNHSNYTDDYDVNDYSDPEEFYYYHRDDFYDYEDAEDYYNSHHN